MAPNAGIVLLICAVLGLLVILVDALAFPLALPATSGLGILAILVVPAIVKPQSVGVLGFVGAAAGYLMILGCSHWFAPDPRTRADTARNPGQFRRGAVTAAVALTLTLLLQTGHPGLRPGHVPAGLPAEPVWRRHWPEPDDQPGQQPAQPLRRGPDHLRHERPGGAVPALGDGGQFRRRFLGAG